MPDRLPYQSETEQLVPERCLVVVEPEVSFSVLLGSLESRVHMYLTFYESRRVKKFDCMVLSYTPVFLIVKLVCVLLQFCNSLAPLSMLPMQLTSKGTGCHFLPGGGGGAVEILKVL